MTKLRTVSWAMISAPQPESRGDGIVRHWDDESRFEGLTSERFKARAQKLCESNSSAMDIVFVTLSKHSSCAVHKSLGNGEGTPP